MPQRVSGSRLWKALENRLVWLIDGIIVFYQRRISPFLPSKCRYYPSCSHYFRQSLRKYGLFGGIIAGFWRILRCNPLFPGGIEPILEGKDEVWLKKGKI